MIDWKRTAAAIAALCSTLLGLGSVWACDCNDCPNCPSDGAVDAPAGLELSLPFPEGENVLLLSGYGPSGGSGLHCRVRDTTCANDWYGIDFVLPDHDNYGYGQDVVAAASGTVRSAGWGTEGWASYGRRVYVELDDPGDGHGYLAVYAHLASVAVSDGQHVDKGAVLGTLGSSCNNADSCSNFSTPHLHFAIHQDSSFGGSGSGGSYGGRAVIPEPMDGYTGLTQGETLVSHNGGGSVTPSCEVVIGDAEVVLEEDGPCAELTGGALEPATGHGDHAYFTVQDNPAPDYAEGLNWLLTFAAGGSYELAAYVPASVANRSPSAEYKVQYGAESSKIYLDQEAAADDWRSLGTFTFAAGGEQFVRLGDDFLDAAAEGKNVAFDALRVRPSTGCDCSEAGATESRACDAGSAQSRSCDGCSWSAWSPCGSGVGGQGAAGTGGGGATGASGPTGGALPAGTGGDDGCGCRLAGRPGRSGAGGLAFAVAAASSLRRRSRPRWRASQSEA